MRWYVDSDRDPVNLATVRGPDGRATTDVWEIAVGPAGFQVRTLWARTGLPLTTAAVARAVTAASADPVPADDTPPSDPTPTPGGGGGTVDPAQVQSIVNTAIAPLVGRVAQVESDTAFLGDTDAEPDQVLAMVDPETKAVTWTTPEVGGTIPVRVWEADSLLYATQFEGGVPSWVTYTNGGGANLAPAVVTVASTAGASKPAYDTALNAQPGGGAAAYTGTTTLALSTIAAVTGKTVSRVKFRWSFQRGTGADVSGSIATAPDGVQRVTSPAGLAVSTATPWATAEIVTSAASLVLRVVKPSGTQGTGLVGYLITGLEVYGVVTPYALGEVVLHNGTYWRSLQANNPYVPGSGQGWEPR